MYNGKSCASTTRYADSRKGACGCGYNDNDNQFPWNSYGLVAAAIRTCSTHRAENGVVRYVENASSSPPLVVSSVATSALLPRVSRRSLW
ncbi:hypothetical protein DPMN_050906 [Dreissena polymorpha]|uniref:Uncharacterized protein n=1 Tax=Dreissena polymorpha TaxID=45954 RepID=A0A9D4CIF8_DREPO|nr:hypothetical protein DPMN_050906 [Dreissena polymorpha]